jgi:hypothetical protein
MGSLIWFYTTCICLFRETETLNLLRQSLPNRCAGHSGTYRKEWVKGIVSSVTVKEEGKAPYL